MRIALGAALAAGLLLLASPWLWPRRERERRRASSPLADRLARAGLGGIPARTLVALSVLAAAAIGGLALAITAVPGLGLAGAVAGALAPGAIVASRAVAVRRAARAAWPDLIDHLVAALRSGVPLPDAVAGLSGTGPAAFRDAFAAFGVAYRSTGNFELCVDRLKERLADPVADRLLETLRMAREVGGTELPSVLRALAGHLRQEAAARGELEARQSWVRGAAKLGVAAPWAVLALLSTREEAAAAYATPSGITLIVGALVVSAVAYRLMLAAGRLPEERRWFR